MQLDIQHLTKIYPNGFNALKDVNLNLMPGVTGLLGPNGAGKSTLLKVLTDVEKTSGGHISYLDHQNKGLNLKKELGYVPQTFGLPESLTGDEFLRYMATAKGIGFREVKSQVNDLLEVLRLTAGKDNRISTYSGGMKQRLGIAQALLGRPQLLILDEPTVGLDPDERFNLRQIITEIAGETIVLLSTHIVSDVESVANNIVIMVQGEIKACGGTEELLESINDYVWEITVKPEGYSSIQDTHLVSNSYRYRDGIKIRLVAVNPPEGAIAVAPTLEEVYLFYTHRSEVLVTEEDVR